MRWSTLALMVMLLLTGCGSAQLAMMTSGPPVALLKTADGTELVTGACDTGLSSTCERIQKTDNPADEAAWRYVAKIRVQGGLGQPYGEASIPIYVLGPIEKCQAMVAKAVKVPEDRGEHVMARSTSSVARRSSMTTLARITLVLFCFISLAGCGERMILYNPNSGLCDEMPKAAAYAMGGALFAATQDVDKWRCEGLKDGDNARTEKPTTTK